MSPKFPLNMTKQKPHESVASLLKPYPGKWVALSKQEDKVVSVANSARTVLARAHKKGESCPHLVKAPDSSIAVFIY